MIAFSVFSPFAISQSKVAVQPRSLSPKRNGFVRQHSTAFVNLSSVIPVRIRAVIFLRRPSVKLSTFGSGPLPAFQAFAKSSGRGPGRGVASIGFVDEVEDEDEGVGICLSHEVVFWLSKTGFPPCFPAIVRI